MVLMVVWAVTTATLKVDGNGTCPTPQQVQHQLAELLPAGARSDHLASIHTHDATLLLELRDADGTSLASKALELRPSCEALAEISAVVLAAWEAQFAEHTPAAREVADAVKEPVAEPAMQEVPDEQPSRWPGLEGGGALLFSYGGSVGAGGIAHITNTPQGSAWGVEFIGLLGGVQQLGGGPTGIDWVRLGLGAGPRLRLIDATVRIDAHAEVLVAKLSTRRGPTNWSNSELDIGVLGGVRAVLTGHIAKPWLGLGVFAWPKSHPFELPVVEGVLFLGLSLGAP